MKLFTSTFLGDTAMYRTIGGSLVALTRYSPERSFEEWHAHDNASISFLLSGTHEEELLGKHHRRVPGDIKFIPAGEQHRCNEYTAGTQKINLDLDQHLLRKMEVKEDDLQSLMVLPRQAKFTLLKLYRELDDQAAHSTASTQLLLYELLHKQKSPVKAATGGLPGWATKLQQILQDEWNAAFDLHDLAERTGVHPVTISKYFPSYFSDTLSTYAQSIKVERALNLIRSTSVSLTEIAYTCGFADQAHFTRTFKAHTGFLPKHFRKL